MHTRAADGESRPRVLVLAVHPPSVAATRLRAVQFVPFVLEAGLEVRVWSFFTSQDLPAWYGRSQLGRLLVVLRALLRLAGLPRHVRGAAVVLVQREALPFGPPVVEILAGWRRRLVWDVDDAIWQSFTSPTAGSVPQWVRATGGKYRVLCRRADEVWAGSEVLAEWCRSQGGSVSVIPTVVPVGPRSEAADRTVGWVGSHSTAPFLEQVLPAVADVQPAPKVVAVGAQLTLPGGLAADTQPWSQQAEDSALARTRVGLYPVDRSHPLAEGKCGLKAVLYMAHGIPSVVTPTRTNAEVVRHEQEALHADSPEEWTQAVQRLLDDDDLWRRLSDAAHDRARSHYSLEVWGPRVARRLADLVRSA